MEGAHRRRLTEHEYLVLERAGEVKHEYVGGEMVAMAGGSPRHNAICGNVVGVLRDLLRDRPCLVLPSDQRVQVEGTGLYTYPDVSVVCGRPRFSPKDDHTLLNPVLIVEVLSESTEAYDRGAKFAHYRRLQSLQEYIVVTAGEERIEHFCRQDGGTWLLTEVSGVDAAVELPVLGVSLPLAEVYAKLELLLPEPTVEP